jgi:hypothetical protein
MLLILYIFLLMETLRSLDIKHLPYVDHLFLKAPT